MEDRQRPLGHETTAKMILPRSSIVISICVSLMLGIGCEATGPDETSSPGGTVLSPYAWPVSTPGSAGLDTMRIDSALSFIRSHPFIHSFLVVKSDSLVVEYYRAPLTSFNDYDLRSATKSFVSVLVGIAHDEGLLPDLDATFLSVFPEYVLAGQDPRKDSVTFRHLLTMRGGFDHEDGGKNSDVIGASDDWLRAYINLPLKFSPGQFFSYSSLQTHMLSAAVSRLSGMSTEAFLQSRVFDPLKISLRYWDKDPLGYNSGGTGMFLTPRDMARFGHMVLRHGVVDGRQVVSKAWLDSSFVPRNTTDIIGTDLGQVNYGYQWWLNREPGKKLRMAWGYAGQFVILDPEKDLIIVATAEPPDDGGSALIQEAVILNTIVRFVLPAAS